MIKPHGILREEEQPAGGIGGGGGAPPEGTPAPAATDFTSEDTYQAFVASLPEDQRGSKLLTETKTLGSLLEQTINAQSALGTKRLATPQEDWTEDQWKDFHRQAGRPETLDGYSFEEKMEIKLGDQQDIHNYEVAPETATIMREIANDMDLTPRQAKILMKKWAEQDISAMGAVSTQEAASVAEQQNALKVEWGSEHEVKHRAANEAYEALAQEIPELRELMAWSPVVANNAGVMKLFERLSPMLAQSGIVGKGTPSAGFGEATVAGLKADISALRADNAELINTNPSELSMADRSKRDGILNQITEYYKKLHPAN